MKHLFFVVFMAASVIGLSACGGNGGTSAYNGDGGGGNGSEDPGVSTGNALVWNQGDWDQTDWQ